MEEPHRVSRSPLVPLVKPCEHRWDWLKITGGWGDGGRIEVKCSGCDRYLDFDIDDAYLGPLSSEQREHFSEKGRKYYLRTMRKGLVG